MGDRKCHGRGNGDGTSEGNDEGHGGRCDFLTRVHDGFSVLLEDSLRHQYCGSARGSDSANRHRRKLRLSLHAAARHSAAGAASLEVAFLYRRFARRFILNTAFLKPHADMTDRGLCDANESTAEILPREGVALGTPESRPSDVGGLKQRLCLHQRLLRLAALLPHR